MTPEKFASIKKSIESAKEKKARAEGALAKIEESWLSEFEINNIDEAKEKVNELETEIESDKKKLEKQYSQLEKIVDWDNV
jgi:hypothetical protein